jgi:O-antigen/teichoic acid export membrane protein
MWRAAIRYRRFPLVATFSTLINTAGFAAPVVLLGVFFGAQAAGLYGLTERVLNVPLATIGQSVSQVYMKSMAGHAIGDPVALRSMFLRTAGRLAVYGAVPFGVMAFAAPALFGMIFGASWREAGVFASLLAVNGFICFVVWPLIPTLNMLEQQLWQLYWDIGRLVLTSGSILVAHALHFTLRQAVQSYALALSISYLGHLLLSFRAIQRRIRELG